MTGSESTGSSKFRALPPIPDQNNPPPDQNNPPPVNKAPPSRPVNRALPRTPHAPGTTTITGGIRGKPVSIAKIPPPPVEPRPAFPQETSQHFNKTGNPRPPLTREVNKSQRLSRVIRTEDIQNQPPPQKPLSQPPSRTPPQVPEKTYPKNKPQTGSAPAGTQVARPVGKPPSPRVNISPQGAAKMSEAQRHEENKKDIQKALEDGEALLDAEVDKYTVALDKKFKAAETLFQGEEQLRNNTLDVLITRMEIVKDLSAQPQGKKIVEAALNEYNKHERQSSTPVLLSKIDEYKGKITEVRDLSKNISEEMKIKLQNHREKLNAVKQKYRNREISHSMFLIESNNIITALKSDMEDTLKKYDNLKSLSGPSYTSYVNSFSKSNQYLDDIGRAIDKIINRHPSEEVKKSHSQGYGNFSTTQLCYKLASLITYRGDALNGFSKSFADNSFTTSAEIVRLQESYYNVARAEAKKAGIQLTERQAANRHRIQAEVKAHAKKAAQGDEFVKIAANQATNVNIGQLQKDLGEPYDKLNKDLNEFNQKIRKKKISDSEFIRKLGELETDYWKLMTSIDEGVKRTKSHELEGELREGSTEIINKLKKQLILGLKPQLANVYMENMRRIVKYGASRAIKGPTLSNKIDQYLELRQGVENSMKFILDAQKLGIKIEIPSWWDEVIRKVEKRQGILAAKIRKHGRDPALEDKIKKFDLSIPLETAIASYELELNKTDPFLLFQQEGQKTKSNA